MKKLKSLITVFLLAVVAIVLVPTAFAVITNKTTGTIDLSGIKEKVSVTAYRVMDVHVTDFGEGHEDQNTPEAPVYTWTSEVATWVADHYEDYIDKNNNNAVTEAFNDKDLTNTAALASFYQDLADAIDGREITITGDGKKYTIEETNGNGSDKIENVKMGNYLIIVGNGKKYTYNPSSVNIVPVSEDGAWSVPESTKVVIKPVEINIEKVIKDKGTVTDAQVGDVIPYVITVDVPNYKEGEATATAMVLKDTLSKGLTLNDATLKVYGKKGTTKDELAATTNYTLVKSTGSNNETIITITFNKAQYECTFKGQCSQDPTENQPNADLIYDQVVVEYTATVNKDAITGLDTTTNTAILDFNNNHTDEVTVQVLTYNITIFKVDGDDDNAPLAGAKFSVSLDGTKLEFVEVEAGVYRLPVNDEEETTDLLETDSNGELHVKGLKKGTYTVTEEEAPAGYVKLQNPRTLVITDDDLDGNIEITNEDEETEVLTTNTLEDTIVNTKGSTLPVTGGIGTLIFSIVGIVFMGLGAFLIRNILKKNEVENI